MIKYLSLDYIHQLKDSIIIRLKQIKLNEK